MTSLKRGLSVEDQALVDRLSKLKTEIKDVKQTPSQQEIEDRLAKLKGISPDVYRKPAVFTTYSNPNVDPVTQLLNQVTEETAIDSQSDHPVEMDQTPSHVRNLHLLRHINLPEIDCNSFKCRMKMR